ncbi:MAG TPA: hypothetical protein VFY92_04515 [Hyphomicrobiaceae bacterium]|nr:hypothetical protein [Hyphomicrobiaceae bacterium]
MYSNLRIVFDGETRARGTIVSFRPETGTYLAASDEVRVCPYLK